MIESVVLGAESNTLNSHKCVVLSVDATIHDAFLSFHRIKPMITAGLSDS